MKTARTPDPQLPWYKQFWPWLLIGLLMTSVVMGLVFAYVATHGTDPVIDDDYYQHGLTINKDLDKPPTAKH